MTPSIYSSFKFLGYRYFKRSSNASKVLPPNSFLQIDSYLIAGTSCKDVIMKLISVSLKLLLSNRSLSANPPKCFAASYNAKVWPSVKVISFSSNLPCFTLLKIAGDFSFQFLHVSSKTSIALGFPFRAKIADVDLPPVVVVTPDLLY